MGALGLWVGLVGVLGAVPPLHIAWLVPLTGVDLVVDPLGGVFLMVIGAVAIPVGLYAIGYARRDHLGAVPLAVLPVFVAAMLLVPAAGSITTFLLAWELMALSSLVLVLAEHTRDDVRSAGLLYAVMTQLGFVAILIGLVVLSAAGGADRFEQMGPLSEGTRIAVFALTVAGFGSKAGLVPVHAWLPRAHPEAPSPVSALMSAAMVTLGVYGIVRFDVQLLGPGPSWWGATLLVVGAVSALYGVLQATVAADLKRLLAYSTTENMGLITLALGAATLFSEAGEHSAASIAMAAALLHVMGHAAFKCLGFLAAGSVLLGTGLRDLDRLGGLARTMPATTILFGVGALGAAGLPLGAGFVSEWMLIQSLIHANAAHNTLVALSAPLALAAVALTTGLGVAAMVKAFGIGFLARPRSDEAAEAKEASSSMRVGMAIAALACVVLAVAPMVVAPVLRRVLHELPASSSNGFADFGTVIHLPGVTGSISPGLLAASLCVAVGVAVLLGSWRRRRRPRTVELPLWACGGADLTARMQYTATSFAEPLQRVFDDALRPDTDIVITHLDESRYMARAVTYRSQIVDPIEARAYPRVVAAVLTAARWMRRVHTGSVHLYLAYGGVGVLIMLVVAR